jgi:UDP-glucose 4-epimerase
VETIRRVTGSPLPARHGPAEAGDVRVTSARIDKAARLLGYAPRVDLETGIRRQWLHVQHVSGGGGAQARATAAGR